MARTNKGPLNGDYEVGHGKPPVAHQFKPGNPGPTKGQRARKKKAMMSMDDVVRDLLEKKVRVKRGGGTIRVGMKEVIISRLATMLTQGTARDMKLVLDLVKEYAPQAVADATLEIVLHRAAGSSVAAPPDALFLDDDAGAAD